MAAVNNGQERISQVLSSGLQIRIYGKMQRDIWGNKLREDSTFHQKGRSHAMHTMDGKDTGSKLFVGGGYAIVQLQSAITPFFSSPLPPKWNSILFCRHDLHGFSFPLKNYYQVFALYPSGVTALTMIEISCTRLGKKTTRELQCTHA